MAQDPLALAFHDLARSVADRTSPETVAHLVARHAATLLPITTAGIGFARPGRRPPPAADVLGDSLERLQADAQQGPGVDACRTGRLVSVADLDDLDDDPRFPRWAARARAAGIAGALALPLISRGHVLGALHLYRTTSGPLDEEAVATARLLADVAAAHLAETEARRRRTEDVGVVSHELRVPLTAVRGYAELLRDGDAGPLNAGQARYVEAVLRNAERLRRLAERVLEQVVTPAPPMGQAPRVDLRDVLAAATDALWSPLDERGPEVSLRLPAGPVVVHGHTGDLERVVINLLGNAVKVTGGADGRVRASVDAAVDVGGAAVARIAVTDNGPGIPASEHGALFSRLFRTASSRRDDVPGTGLGLHIVDVIVHDHGGRVWVDSRPGRGATFTVELPLADAGATG